MSKDPFDQEAFDEAPDTLPRTPDGRTDVAGVIAERRRRAALVVHTNTTLERGLAVLADRGTSTLARDEALSVLIKAEPKYRRLGGQIPYWSHA